jgi:SHS2 domain-containing protein
MKPGFAEFDHSGDIGIEASGATLAELLENATRGLFGLLYRGAVAPVAERNLAVTSQSHEDLLVDWLGEVITAASAFGEAYRSVEITRTGEFFAEGVLKGEPLDADRHDLRFDVKAATYHALEVTREGGRWHARVIFDL